MGSSVKNSMDDNIANDMCFGSSNGVDGNYVGSGTEVGGSGDFKEYWLV